MTLGNGSPKPVGTWDWYGGYDPAHNRSLASGKFSIGVFRWEARRDGQPKKGTVVQRFSGPVGFPDEVYAQARAFIAQQQAVTGTRSVPSEALIALCERWEREAAEDPEGSPSGRVLRSCAGTLRELLDATPTP